MGAVLQQRVQGVWQLLAFFSRNLSGAEIQRLGQGAPGDLRRREVLRPHAEGPTFYHPDRPQVTNIRLATEEGYVFAEAV